MEIYQLETFVIKQNWIDLYGHFLCFPNSVSQSSGAGWFIFNIVPQYDTTESGIILRYNQMVLFLQNSGTQIIDSKKTVIKN